MKIPKYGGNYVLKHIKEFDPDTKVIIIIAFPETEPDMNMVHAIMEKPTHIKDLLDLLEN